MADAGPLGYRSIAAHGHADALSFTLSVGGREFLIDPGTYAYHTQERWRAVLPRHGRAQHACASTALDQSEPGGNFMWTAARRAPAAACGCRRREKDSFEGWHDGYARLEDPVKHRRLIELDKRARRFLIEDTLEMAGEHDVELFFHCAEDCEVEAVAGGYLLSRDGITVTLKLPANGAAAWFAAAWRRCWAGSRAASTSARRPPPSCGAHDSPRPRSFAPRSRSNGQHPRYVVKCSPQ